MMSQEKKLYNVVVNALKTGSFEQAIAACRHLNSHYPDFFDGWRIAGDLHQRLKKPEAGLIAADRALSIRPEDIDIQLQQVACLMSLERIEEARALLLRLSQRDIHCADTHDRIGLWLASMDLHEQALSQYQKAIALEPANAVLYYNAASAQRFLGLIEEAEKNLDLSLSLNELDYEAQLMRSSLRAQTDEFNHIDQLKRLLTDKDLPARGAVSVRYALAKELDDLGDCEQSFLNLKYGADERRRQMDYRVETDLDVMSAIKESYPSDMFARKILGDSSDEPIFIIGLPRTGTTLVERILGSHSAVFAAGELNNFAREMMRQVNGRNDAKSASRLTLVKKTTELDFSALGRAYLDSTRPMTGFTPKFIDKLPFNFLYAGLIHLALPNARIINLTRHPMAACYAIYKQLFRDAYPFSYDLEDLANYYVAYHQLLTHWHTVMPNVVYSVAYEDVVANTEGESRALIDYCGLEWEDRCLDFHENKQASTTASATQVRQPVYSSSVDKWRKYREHLRPLEVILNANGIDTQ